MRTTIVLAALLIAGSALALAPTASASTCSLQPHAAVDCTLYVAGRCVETLAGVTTWGIGGEAKFCN